MSQLGTTGSHLGIKLVLQAAQLAILSVQIAAPVCQGVQLLSVLGLQAISLPVKMFRLSLPCMPKVLNSPCCDLADTMTKQHAHVMFAIQLC